MRYMRETNLGLARENPTTRSAEFTSYADKSFVNNTVQLIDVMVNLKRLDEAKEIQKRAIGYFPDQKIKDAIPQY